MPQAYRLVVTTPATVTTGAKTWEFTRESHNVVHIDCTLRKEGKRVSYLDAQIIDPGWKIFSELPDIAFANVPVKLYLVRHGASTPTLVFDGKATALQPVYPGPEMLAIVAHDKSVNARKKGVYSTLKNLTSVQLVHAIAKQYGYSVDADVGTAQIFQRKVDIGAGISDWDHMRRSLSADGLYLHVHGNTLRIRQQPSIAYPTTFKRGEAPIIRLECSINHVRAPGQGGDVKTPTPGEHNATAVVHGIAETERTAAAADLKTHRQPVSGAASTAAGAHTEDMGARSWSNVATRLRSRKDEATLTCTVLPDYALTHTATLDGFGGKVDGSWFTEQVRHQISGSDELTTTIQLMRGPSDAALRSAGVPIPGEHN